MDMPQPARTRPGPLPPFRIFDRLVLCSPRCIAEVSYAANRRYRLDYPNPFSPEFRPELTDALAPLLA